MDRDVSAPRAVREGDHDPVDHRVDDLEAGVVDVVRGLVDLPGRSVVVAPVALVEPLPRGARRAPASTSPPGSAGSTPRWRS